jgi:hypothetical protein
MPQLHRVVCPSDVIKSQQIDRQVRSDLLDGKLNHQRLTRYLHFAGIHPRDFQVRHRNSSRLR